MRAWMGGVRIFMAISASRFLLRALDTVNIVSKTYRIPTLRVSARMLQYPDALVEAVSQKVNLAPHFFAKLPIIVSFENISDEDLTITNVLDAYRGLSLLSSITIAGLTGRLEELSPALHDHGIVVFAAGSSAEKQAVSRHDSQDGGFRLSSTSIVPSAKLHHGSIRSGQQVYAKNQSIIVWGNVNSGGEVIADGDVHVYGHLRGRASAGLCGDRGSKILATSFSAELLSISDVYVVDPLNGSESGAVIASIEEIEGDDSIVLRDLAG